MTSSEKANDRLSSSRHEQVAVFCFECNPVMSYAINKHHIQ